MKTYSYSSKRLSIYSLFGLIAFAVSSCGSYQNSSYYDRDGVYGNSQNKREVSNKDNSQSSKYQDYFSNLNKESQSFTDVDKYSTVNNDTIKRTENYNSNNSSWGSNPQSVTVNVYDSNWGYGYWNNYWYGNYWGYNNYYGPSFGWGWNSWYGPSWSLGWSNWYGPSYYGYYGGYYNNWYGNNYHNNYYYNGGRRGSAYAYSSNGNRYGVRNGTRTSNFNGGRSNSYSTSGNRNTHYNNTRTSSTEPVRNYNSNPTRTNTYSQPTRSNNNESAPVRSYAPSSNTRSSSYGGGSYGGGSGGGGGRSSSGGGRR